MAHPLQHTQAAFGTRLPAAGACLNHTATTSTGRGCQHAIGSHSTWYKISVRPAIDLSPVKLPEVALIFPSTAGETFDLTRLRDPHAVSREFRWQVRARGFPKLRFHDLRGSHETALLDAGVPVQVVAAQCGHEPAVLLRTYAKRTRKADINAAIVLGALTKSILGGWMFQRL